jgi:hypothetical protein
VKLSALLPAPPVEPGQEGLRPDSPGSSMLSGEVAGSDGRADDVGMTTVEPGKFVPTGFTGKG